MSDTEQIRVEFEEWAEGELQKSISWMKSTELIKCISFFMERGSNGEYRNLEIRGQFQGWQARNNEIAALREEIEHYKSQLDLLCVEGLNADDVKKLKEYNYSLGCSNAELLYIILKIRNKANQLKLAKASTYHNEMGKLIEEIIGVDLEKRGG